MKNNSYESIPILKFKTILEIKSQKEKEIYLKNFFKIKKKFIIIDFENQSYTIQILNEIFNLLFDLQKKEKFYFAKHPRTRLSIYFDVKYFLGN